MLLTPIIIILTRSDLFIRLLLIVVHQLYTVGATQVQRDDEMNFSGGFEDFLEGLKSKVFERRRIRYEEVTPKTYTIRTTTINVEELRIKNTVRKTKMDLLNNVLMMKLVSYYESKYKVNERFTVEPPTTEPTTVATASTNFYSAEFNEIVEKPIKNIEKQKKSTQSYSHHTYPEYEDTPEVIINSN